MRGVNEILWRLALQIGTPESLERAKALAERLKIEKAQERAELHIELRKRAKEGHPLTWRSRIGGAVRPLALDNTERTDRDLASLLTGDAEIITNR